MEDPYAATAWHLLLLAEYQPGHTLLWDGIPFLNQESLQVSQRGSLLSRQEQTAAYHSYGWFAIAPGPEWLQAPEVIRENYGWPLPPWSGLFEKLPSGKRLRCITDCSPPKPHAIRTVYFWQQLLSSTMPTNSCFSPRHIDATLHCWTFPRFYKKPKLKHLTSQAMLGSFKVPPWPIFHHTQVSLSKFHPIPSFSVRMLNPYLYTGIYLA